MEREREVKAAMADAPTRATPLYLLLFGFLARLHATVSSRGGGQ